MIIKIHALRNKKTGRAASRPDAEAVAINWRAIQLEQQGLATGIASLLLPLSQRDLLRIRKLQATYNLVQVTPRRSRLAVKRRERIADPDFRSELLSVYLASLTNNQKAAVRLGKHQTLKQILNWIEDTQKDKRSPLFQFLRIWAPELVYGHSGNPHSESRKWWATQLALHKIK